MALRLRVRSGGLLTTVQDLGRWGYQAMGMPVAGAMDPEFFQIANILAGNAPNDAALEVTVLGPTLLVEGQGAVAVAGADLGFSLNGRKAPLMTNLFVREGDVLSFDGTRGSDTSTAGGGCRTYLACSGGIDVPVVMGSRSTYLRARIGGFEGRNLKAGDLLCCDEAPPLAERTFDFSCPERLRPHRDLEAPLRAVPGPQDDAFSEEGLRLFFESAYTISEQSDRMGYRLEGPSIPHREGADIVSDAIPLGAVQVPGHGKPIVMLADRQTTGGYTKIAVVATADLAVLAQRMPGQGVHFVRATPEEGARALQERANRLAELLLLRSTYRSRPKAAPLQVSPSSGAWRMTVEGKSYDVSWQEL